MKLDFSHAAFPAIFLRRINRFLVSINIEGEQQLAHLANSGRLVFLRAGAPCWVVHRSGKGRKTQYDLLAMETEAGPVIVDARLPNYIVQAAWREGDLLELQPFDKMQAEYTYGNSRLDFAFWQSEKEALCLVEVKSAADWRDGYAYFPDAPSLRAGRHLQELTIAVQKGQQALVVFLAAMPKARGVVLNKDIDPGFVKLAREAQKAGVHLTAYAVQGELPGKLGLGERVPVLIDC